MYWPLDASRVGYRYFSLQNRPQSVVSHDKDQTPATKAPIAAILSPARGASQTVTLAVPARRPAVTTVTQETAATVTAPNALTPQDTGQPLIPKTVLNFVGKY